MGLIRLVRQLLPDRAEAPRIRRTPTVGPNQIAFGGELWPEDHIDPHFLFVGATGSGKTRNVRMLMRTALFDDGERLRRHAIIFDAKKEWIPLLRGMSANGVPPTIHILNPFDRRRTTWALADDIRTRVETRQLAEYLIPTNEKLTQPYFADCARLILGAVVNTFAELAPSAWTLRDIIEACRTEENLDRVLAATDYGRSYHERFVRVRSGPEIEATLLSRLAAFTEVAACSHTQPGETVPISLTRWLDGPPSILLIGTDEQAEAALRPLNSVLFRRLFELLSARNERKPAHGGGEGSETVWLFIDEARLAGKLEGIDHVLLKGRSKGVRVVLTCQEIQGLQHVYGKERAEELLSQCTNRAVLRTSNAQTKEWFAKSIGDREKWNRGTSTTSGSQQNSNTESWQLQIRASILGSEFAELARPSPAAGFHGFFDLPGEGWWKAHVKPEFVSTFQGADPTDTSDGFEPWSDPSHQVLHPWEDEDLVRLGLHDVQPLSRTEDSPVESPNEHAWADLLGPGSRGSA